MLALDGVRFAFGAHTVLDHVSLAVAARSLVCIVGPNGAGKSTLLRLAAGLLRPAAGSVRTAGVDPGATERRRFARRVAYMPQDYALVFPFTVGEVVLMGRYPHRGVLALENDEDARLAARAMERCDLGALADRRFDALSGGERRRALLAQAICQAADLLLLDEPTVSLDPGHADDVFRLLDEDRRRRGTTAVVVTHDLNLAARWADRLVLVDEGRIAATGEPADVLGSPAAARAYGVRLHVGEAHGVRFVVPLPDERRPAPPPADDPRPDGPGS
jgi:iron complex transport system ATP-binding protein